MASAGVICLLCLDFKSDAEGEDWLVNAPGGHVFHNSCITRMLAEGYKNLSEDVTLNSLTRLYGFDTCGGRARAMACNNDFSLSSKQPDYTFKIVILGDSQVGKSTLMKRFTTGVYHPDLSATIGLDQCFQRLEIGEKVVKLNIWDTTGQERFRARVLKYVRSAHGILLVYDVNSRRTLNGIQDCIKDFDELVPTGAAKLLVGNKIDHSMETRAVTYEQGRLNWDYPSLKLTARESYNVEAAFRYLTAEILVRHLGAKAVNDGPLQESSLLDLRPDESTKAKQKSSCRW